MVKHTDSNHLHVATPQVGLERSALVDDSNFLVHMASAIVVRGEGDLLLLTI